MGLQDERPNWFKDLPLGFVAVAHNMEATIKAMESITNNEVNMEQTMRSVKADEKREDRDSATINYHTNGIEVDLGDGRSIRAMETAANEPDGMYFEFVGQPKHGNPDEISFYQEADDGTPFITLGLTNRSCMILFLMLAELEDRGFFGIEDMGDAMPETVDNRNDKTGQDYE